MAKSVNNTTVRGDDEMVRTIIYCVCICLMTYLWYHFPDFVSIFITDSGYRNNHFNLLSTAAILAGFMFTALSMLMGMADKKIIQSLAQTTILDKKQSRMILGIKADIGCILCAALFVLGIDRYIPNIIKLCLFSIEITFLALGLYYLYKAMKDILRLLDITKPSKVVSEKILEEQRKRMNK